MKMKIYTRQTFANVKIDKYSRDKFSGMKKEQKKEFFKLICGIKKKKQNKISNVFESSNL